jgi:hypothetical protein
MELPQAWTIAVEGGAEPEPAGTLAGEVDRVTWSPSGVLALIGNDAPFAAGWATVGRFVVDGDPDRPRHLAPKLDLPVGNTT